MKYLFILTFTSSLLFSGGDFLALELETKFEKIDNDESYLDASCNIGCGMPAVLMPYNGDESIPIIDSEPCLYDVYLT